MSLVRPVRPEDVPTVLELVHELATFEQAPEAVVATAFSLSDVLFCDSPSVFAHVIEHNGSIGGYAFWFRTFSTWLGKYGGWIDDLYVRPELRGQGYGKALVDEVQRSCVERGYGRLEWITQDWNQAAIDFYVRRGAMVLDEWRLVRMEG